MKKCYKCDKDKSLSAFYKNKSRGDGHAAECKECAKTLQSADYKKAYNASYSKRKDVRANNARLESIYRLKYPEKHYARSLVSNALRCGNIQRLPCLICGITDSVEAHHTDYSEPYNITWLCREHHKKLHNKINEHFSH